MRKSVAALALLFGLVLACDGLLGGYDVDSHPHGDDADHDNDDHDPSNHFMDHQHHHPRHGDNHNVLPAEVFDPPAGDDAVHHDLVSHIANNNNKDDGNDDDGDMFLHRTNSSGSFLASSSVIMAGGNYPHAAAPVMSNDPRPQNQCIPDPNVNIEILYMMACGGNKKFVNSVIAAASGVGSFFGGGSALFEEAKKRYPNLKMAPASWAATSSRECLNAYLDNGAMTSNTSTLNNLFGNWKPIVISDMTKVEKVLVALRLAAMSAEIPWTPSTPEKKTIKIIMATVNKPNDYDSPSWNGGTLKPHCHGRYPTAVETGEAFNDNDVHLFLRASEEVYPEWHKVFSEMNVSGNIWPVFDDRDYSQIRISLDKSLSHIVCSLAPATSSS